MDKKKICIVVIIISILALITGLIVILNIDENSIESNSNGKLAKKEITNQNIISQNPVNEMQLVSIEQNTNEIKLQSNVVNTNIIEFKEHEITFNVDTNKKEEQPSKKSDIVSKETQNEENKINNNIQTNTTLTQNTNEETKIENTQKPNEQNVITKVDTTVKNEVKEIVVKEESQEGKNKKIAKQNLLNSISTPTDFLYRKTGDKELKFNKTEALRVANAIIDESFKHSKLWDGEKLLYKIEFKYIEGIMQNSMYWPFRETAIASSTNNKNTNGTFYIWAEDYIYQGEKVHTQYCIR